MALSLAQFYEEDEGLNQQDEQEQEKHKNWQIVKGGDKQQQQQQQQNENDEESQPCTYAWQCGERSCLKDPENHLVFCHTHCQRRYREHKQQQQMAPYDNSEEIFVNLWRLRLNLEARLLVAQIQEGINVTQLEKDDAFSAIELELLENQHHIANKFVLQYGEPMATTLRKGLEQDVRHFTLTTRQAIEWTTKNGPLDQSNMTPNFELLAPDYNAWQEQADRIINLLVETLQPDEESSLALRRLARRLIFTLTQIMFYQVAGFVDETNRYAKYAMEQTEQVARLLWSMMSTVGSTLKY
jgi:hypothetical protein